MKLVFSILLMSTVLLCEAVNVFEIKHFEKCHMDSSMEGEVEKELAENIEDVVKIKFYNSSFSFFDNSSDRDVSVLNWVVSPPCLEIHSPPPELILRFF